MQMQSIELSSDLLSRMLRDLQAAYPAFKTADRIELYGRQLLQIAARYGAEKTELAVSRIIRESRSLPPIPDLWEYARRSPGVAPRTDPKCQWCSGVGFERVDTNLVRECRCRVVKGTSKGVPVCG
jgi:hypothetical protein